MRASIQPIAQGAIAKEKGQGTCTLAFSWDCWSLDAGTYGFPLLRRCQFSHLFALLLG